jgi:hypothetical protein
MKTFLIIVIITTGFLAMNSCKDSLGYDPNVEIISLTKDTMTVPDQPSTKVYMVDSIRYIFNEMGQFGPLPDWIGKSDYLSLQMDTSSNPFTIYLNWEMRNTKNDNDYMMMRNDYVMGFQLNFVAKLSKATYILNSDSTHGKWFSLCMRNIHKDHIDYFSSMYNNDLTSQINIVRLDTNLGMLQLYLQSRFRDDIPYNIKGFNGNISIFYKKK